MKYLLTMVLALIVSIPVSAQRHQGKRTHDKAKVVSTTKCDKDCKCVCHKKDAKKHDHKKAASKGRGSRGKRGFQRSSFRGRSDRSGSKRSTSRRSRTRNVPPTKKAKDAKEVKDIRKKWLDINSDERKKWGDALKKRLQDINKESRRVDWRKFARTRK
jgi:hypothetical protein